MPAGAPEGNQNAAKGKSWQKSLARALARLANGDVDSGLDKVADKVVELAVAGDKDAWQEIGNRFDGKPAQSLSLASDPDNPFEVTVITRKVIK